MTNSLLPSFSSNLEPPEHRCVVRVKTSSWSDSKGIYITKRITYQKRKSWGYGLSDFVSDGCLDSTLDRIANTQDVSDGLYEVLFIPDGNEDYIITLVPYN